VIAEHLGVDPLAVLDSLTEHIALVDRPLSVVATAGETREQRDLLQTMGCSKWQGHLSGEPEPLPQFEERVAASRLPAPAPGQALMFA